MNTSSGTVAFGATKPAWLIVALAIAMTAMLIAGLATPAQAEGHEGDATLTAMASCSEGGSIDFYVTNNEAELDMDLVSAEIFFGVEESISYNGEGPIESGIAPDEMSGTYSFEGLENGDYVLEVYVQWDLGEGFLDAWLGAEITVDCDGEGGIDCSEGGCESFEDPNGEWTATCDGCTGSVIIKDPGDAVAEIVVTGKTPFVLTLTTTGRGPNPGKASVDIDNDLDDVFESTLPRCGKNGTANTNCVHIQRVGGHTQYKVFYNEDPGFSFK